MLKTTAATTSRAARRQNAPRALQLSHTAQKASEYSLQSPLRDGAFLQVSARPTPPPAASPWIPFPTPSSPFLQSPHQRMANLTACLTFSKPGEVLYPSLGQVATAAQHISTFLDLYRVRASDDAHLAHVKSPTSTGGAPWAPLAPPSTPPPRRRRGTLRRSRSLSDLERGVAVTSDAVHAPGARRAATLEDRPPHGRAPLFCAAGADSSARRTAEPRRRLPVGPRAAPPAAPLPSPPPPSALLRVKSPPPPVMVAPHAAVVVPQRSARARFATVPPSNRRVLRSPQAPYWLKSARTGGAPPKTPRTVRRERRQGWGGTRVMGGIGPAAQRRKEGNIA